MARSADQPGIGVRSRAQTPRSWRRELTSYESDRAAIELVVVDRIHGDYGSAACVSCGRTTPVRHGLFVGSRGEPCGLVELCSECAPRIRSVVRAMVELLPPGTGALLTED